MYSPPIFFILPTPLSPVLRFFSSPPPPDLILSPLLPPSSSPGLPLRAPLPRPSPLSSLPSPSPASLPSSSPPVRAAAARSRAAAGLGLRMRGGARRVTAGGHGRGGRHVAGRRGFPIRATSPPSDAGPRLGASLLRTGGPPCRAAAPVLPQRIAGLSPRAAGHLPRHATRVLSMSLTICLWYFDALLVRHWCMLKIVKSTTCL